MQKPMPSWLYHLIIILLVLTSGLLNAQNLVSKTSGPHIQVSLLSNLDTIVPNKPFYVGVLLSPDDEWHTYWRNPGDSGEAPVITLSSESSITVGEVQWPVPEAIPVAHLVNYGYSGATLLMLPVAVDDKSLLGSQVQIVADLSWLVCKEDCIPGWATLALSLNVATQQRESEHVEIFERTKQRLPDSITRAGSFEVNQTHLVLQFANITDDDVFSLPLNANDVQANASGQHKWYAFPFRSDVIQHAAPQQVLHDKEFTRMVLPRSDYFDTSAVQFSWLISNGQTGFVLNTDINREQGFAQNSADERQPSEVLSFQELLAFILMAFVGGLILNLMPCVLPIISIKAIALQHTSATLLQKSAYLLGVVLCFNLFAVAIIALQASGQSIGWGFHMQEPVVIIMLAFLFTFIALLLLDALSVGSGLAGLGQGLISGNSASSHFFTGVLAVVVASPCTAPFMAVALGIALVSDPYVSLLIFNALALGFALPMTLLFASSRFSRWLPKPGAWMITFKHLLAFPMLLTVAWLVWVFLGQTNAQLQFLLISMLIVFSMLTWLYCLSHKRVVKAVYIVFAALCIALPTYLSTSISVSQAENSAVNDADHSNKAKVIPYDPVVLQSLKDDGQVILVNMTADWCITCKVNEQVALNSDRVKTALAPQNVHYMVGDWTNKNQLIFDYLSQYKRAGVPLYVVYAGNQDKQVLPQILSPNLVADAINDALKKSVDSVPKDPKTQP